MPVQGSYLFVILVWSTTPLGIVWSAESMPPTLSVFLRMFIALILAIATVLVLKIHIPRTKNACLLYFYSAAGIVVGMLFSYLAAQSVPSGVISLVFGLAPIISGLFAQRMLSEQAFTAIKIVALVLSILGLFMVCMAQINQFQVPVMGIIYVLFAVTSFSLSGVMIKTIPIAIHPMATTLGALMFVTPIFALIWLISGGEVNYQQWQMKSIIGTVYLAVFGSLLGFLAYFHVLQKLNASTVALTTLITPIFAVSLGALLNGEAITPSLMIGGGMILSGLFLYQFGDKYYLKAKQ
jgi:drug/metabolite transporter (DMT)-like permease